MLAVIYSARAKADLVELLSYLEERSPQAAEKLADAIDQRCEMLAQFPLLGRARDELGAGLRSIVVNQVVIFYKPTDEAIEVVRILHGRRNIDRIMKEPDE